MEFKVKADFSAFINGKEVSGKIGEPFKGTQSQISLLLEQELIEPTVKKEKKNER